MQSAPVPYFPISKCCVLIKQVWRLFLSEELPYLKCPLHTVLKLTPVAYGQSSWTSTDCENHWNARRTWCFLFFFQVVRWSPFSSTSKPWTLTGTNQRWVDAQIFRPSHFEHDDLLTLRRHWLKCLDMCGWAITRLQNVQISECGRRQRPNRGAGNRPRSHLEEMPQELVSWDMALLIEVILLIIEWVFVLSSVFKILFRKNVYTSEVIQVHSEQRSVSTHLKQWLNWRCPECLTSSV